MKSFLLPLSAAVLLTGCWNTSTSNVPRPPLAYIQEAPRFEVRNIAGGTFNSDELKGKVVVVDFWATWCVPCKSEIPEYNRIREMVKDQGVEFVGITFESSDDDIKEFVKEYDMKYPVVLASDAVDAAFGGHRGLPTTFVIGKDSKVYRKYFGATKNKIAYLEQDIQELLARQ